MFKKNEKLRTIFKRVIDEDVINEAYLDEKVSKKHGHLPLLGKDYNGIKLNYNKQSVEETLIQRAVKTTIQVLYDKDFFDNFQKTDKVLKDF